MRVLKDRQEVWCGGKVVDNLSPKEFGLLAAINDAGGKIMSRKALLVQVWGKEYAQYDSRTVDQHFARLRRKLRAVSKAAAAMIVTKTNFGYKLVRK